jgi:hypothetical protein
MILALPPFGPILSLARSTRPFVFLVAVAVLVCPRNDETATLPDPTQAVFLFPWS